MSLRWKQLPLLFIQTIPQEKRELTIFLKMSALRFNLCHKLVFPSSFEGIKMIKK
jgi:hypothetical protein